MQNPCPGTKIISVWEFVQSPLDWHVIPERIGLTVNPSAAGWLFSRMKPGELDGKKVRLAEGKHPANLFARVLLNNFHQVHPHYIEHQVEHRREEPVQAEVGLSSL